MSSKLLINVNDATPAVVPDTDADTNPDTNVPDTGVFSTVHNDGVNNTPNMIAPIIGISVVALVLIALIISLVKKHKQKKTNKFSIYSKGHTILRITGIMTLILITTFVALNYNVKQEDNVSAASNTLTVTTSDIEIDVDLNDKAVFATGESTVTVGSATEAGYTLMAFVDSTTTDLKNETNKSSTSTISMLNTTDFKNPTALTNNTWGIATTKPTSQDSIVFTGLPTTLDTAMTLKITDEATTANDKSTFYYGTYITPDLDYGTYSGTTITYIAIANYAGPCNPSATTIQEAKCLQDFAGPNRDQIVDSMTPETQYTLMDVRDEKSYYISKLADGNVWMTQNLDHDIVTTTDFYTYANTDIGHGSTPNTNATWTAQTATYATNDTTWIDTTDSPESYNPGDLCWNGTIRSDYNGTITTDTLACGNDKHYHIGNYYNWTAAVAMNDSSSYTTDLTDADQSICPAGWRLPTYSGNKSYDNLVIALSLTSGASGNVQSAPACFVYGGRWGGESDSVGGYGVYWSSVVYADAAAYELYFDRDDTMLPQDNVTRDFGGSVRCVARTGDSRPDGVILDISNLTYMQEFATLTSSEKSRVLASMVEGQQYQLKDNRDEKTYYVSKLADGNVWMTQNLDHDIVTTTDFYTYANTDIGHGSTPNTNATWTAERATYATSNTNWGDVYDSYSDPESYDPGDLCWNGTIRSDDNGTISTDTVSCGNDKHYHIGNYYNWTAAVAMNDSSSYTTDEQDVDQSICPAGWRLPTYSGDKSYENLVTELGLTSGTSGNVQNTPTYFVYGGYWYGSSSYVGYGGDYLSSVVNGVSYTYKFYFYHDGRMSPRDSGGRNLGNSVRCVAR